VKGDLVAHSHRVLVRWRNNFFQLLNVHGLNDVTQTEVRTPESLMPETSVFEVEMVIES
jgi:hypothetical protein